MSCRLKILLSAHISDISIFAVGLTNNVPFQKLRKIVKRIRNTLDHLCLVIPLASLLRIELHRLIQSSINGIILRSGVFGRTRQTLNNKHNTIENVRTDIEGEHSHQDDIHEVYHLLAW